jgi:hypothetical protein
MPAGSTTVAGARGTGGKFTGPSTGSATGPIGGASSLITSFINAGFRVETPVRTSSTPAPAPTRDPARVHPASNTIIPSKSTPDSRGATRNLAIVDTPSLTANHLVSGITAYPIVISAIQSQMLRLIHYEEFNFEQTMGAMCPAITQSHKKRRHRNL